MDVRRKLEILADAAKYDASCASSGTEKRDSRDRKGVGSAGRVRGSQRAQTWINRVLGGVFVFLGIRVALMER